MSTEPAAAHCGNNNLAPLFNPRFTGSVAVGTTSPTGTLEVNGGNTKLGSSTIDIYGLLYADAGGAFVLEAANGTNTVKKNIGLAAYGGNVGVATLTPSLKFYVNGTAGGTSAWSSPSDARLKKNIQSLSGGLALVQRLNPVSYDWRSPNERGVGKTLNLAVGEKQVGFIAQEVEKVVPEAVSKPKGPDGTYGLKEESLIPVLVAAIKEQQAEIEQLRASLAALKH